MNCSGTVMRTPPTASWRNDPEPTPLMPSAESGPPLFLGPQNPDSQCRVGEGGLEKFTLISPFQCHP